MTKQFYDGWQTAYTALQSPMGTTWGLQTHKGGDFEIEIRRHGGADTVKAKTPVRLQCDANQRRRHVILQNCSARTELMLGDSAVPAEKTAFDTCSRHGISNGQQEKPQAPSHTDYLRKWAAIAYILHVNL